MIKQSPGVAKHWASWNQGTTPTVTDIYPTSGAGITYGSAAGASVHTFGVTFINNDYAAVLTSGAGGYFMAIPEGNRSTTGCRSVLHSHEAGTTNVNGCSIVVFGEI